VIDEKSSLRITVTIAVRTMSFAVEASSTVYAMSGLGIKTLKQKVLKAFIE
jgi:hypothetical protein